MKRELVAELGQQLINRRCASILTHQNEKADKLKIPRPDYEVAQLRSLVTTAIGRACPYCGRTLTPKNFELDHIVPLCRGGAFTHANSDIIDGACNRKKGSLTREEFINMLVFLETLPTAARADISTRLGIGGRWKR